MSKQRTGAKVVCERDGVSYEFFQPWDDWTPPGPQQPWDDRSLADAIRWMYLEDDYGCDCNLSMFISDLCENAPDEWTGANEDGDLPCGNTIAIVSLTAVENGVETPIPLDDHEIDDRLARLGMVRIGGR